MCERLDRLVAAEGGAAQDALDRVVLEADDQPFGLEEPARRQGPQAVRACPGPLVAGVGVSYHEEHAASLGGRGGGSGCRRDPLAAALPEDELDELFDDHQRECEPDA